VPDAGINIYMRMLSTNSSLSKKEITAQIPYPLLYIPLHTHPRITAPQEIAINMI